MENKIRSTREKLGLTQRQLADAVHTSQQQIARIESGSQSVKLALALSIAGALESSIDRLFPGTKRLLKTARGAPIDVAALNADESSVRELDALGVDVDPNVWRLKLRLRGGAQVDFACSTAEAQRLRNSLTRSGEDLRFVVLRTSITMVALNLGNLIHYHELWDGHSSEDWHDDRVPREGVAVFLSDAATPVELTVDADEGDPTDPEDEGRLRDLLFELESSPESGDFVSVLDIDGEEAFFRVDDLALVSIPLRLLDERLDQELADIEEEETRISAS